MEPFMGFLLKKCVALVGMMGSGKTTIGAALAEELSAPFLDSDIEIERTASMSVAEIFERDGESFFRQKETRVITRFLEKERGILSTGGGAFLNPVNRRTISEKGVALWLRADLNLLWSRVRHESTRPLLQTKDPFSTLAELCEARNSVYELAELHVDASEDCTIQYMTDQVLTTLLTRPDVLERRT